MDKLQVARARLLCIQRYPGHNHICIRLGASGIQYRRSPEVVPRLCSALASSPMNPVSASSARKRHPAPIRGLGSPPGHSTGSVISRSGSCCRAAASLLALLARWWIGHVALDLHRLLGCGLCALAASQVRPVGVATSSPESQRHCTVSKAPPWSDGDSCVPSSSVTFGHWSSLSKREASVRGIIDKFRPRTRRVGVAQRV